ncbi:uncharacterized protein LOC131285891 [Anopheles ziemanni]|uniref:uncharacterized protein LOC131285891 n=1 Tax=Anopheles ziemanni TaxID=345580 RepID=UPI00265ED914|nr:uncharacterized protein LOC131285891 [Anopheles ziemanni]
MGESVSEISNICRFCLSQDGLIPISKATASLFTIEDVEHFTGIQISDEKQLSFAMCENCCKTLENSTSFRRTCTNNDVIFKQLFSILVESVGADINLK